MKYSTNVNRITQPLWKSESSPMLYGCRHFSTLFLTVSQIPQHTVSADQWEARLYHLLFWEKAVRTKRHTQFRGCSRNTEVHAHATRQYYGEIWKQGGQRVPRWDCTRVAMVFWHGDTASRPKSVSLLPWVDTPICLEAPRTGAGLPHTDIPEKAVSVRGR